MINVSTTGVVNYKIINYQGELNVSCVMHPQPGGEWTWVVSMQGQEVLELDIGKPVVSCTSPI